jgi:hypothetical protein
MHIGDGWRVGIGERTYEWVFELHFRHSYTVYTARDDMGVRVQRGDGGEVDGPR